MLTKEEIESALLKTNGDLRAAAVSLKVKYQTLYYHVNKFGLKYTSNKPIIDPTKIQELYERYQSLSLVAKELGCTKEGVRLVMQRHNIATNDPIRYSFNEHFFSEDSEKSFYWAGFIAADGCLKKHGNSDELDIGLSIIDKDHLEKFRYDINSTHPIRETMIKNSKQNKRWNDTKRSEIQLLSKYLPKDLGKFNIVPRKSLIYTFPEWLISHSLLNHFMRGYFDGDGSWFVGPSRKTDQLFFSLRGTPEFLTVYRSILEDKCGLPERTKDIRIDNGIGVLEYGGNGVTCKIRDFLYRDAVTFMQRKFDKVNDVIVVERLSVTPEFLIQKMRELGDQKKIAAELGCSRPNISRYVSKFGIQEQMRKARSLYLEAAA